MMVPVPFSPDSPRCDGECASPHCERPKSTRYEQYLKTLKLERGSQINVEQLGVYSRRVFFGGLPIGITENELRQAFDHFDVERIDWPGKDRKRGGDSRPSGYAFIEFVSDKDVCRLMTYVTIDDKRNMFLLSYMKNGVRRSSYVEAKPFLISDAHFGSNSETRDYNLRTVFLGGLPRDVTARQIQRHMSQYGRVDVVQLILYPTTQYPRGTCYVTFSNTRASLAAMTDGVWKYAQGNRSRTIEIKPFLPMDFVCVCTQEMEACFCVDCLKMVCISCGETDHASHKIIKRGTFYFDKNDLPSSFLM